MSARCATARTLALLAAAAVLIMTVPHPAFAHVYVGDGGPAAGFMHPLTGPDHLLAMYAVGVLSAQLGGRAIWTVPAAFVLVMLVGGILGATNTPLPGTELGVAISVVVLGVAVAAAGRVPTWSALAAAGLFGLFHGHAHGAEMPAVAAPALYALGFAVSTVGLHVLGALTGLLVLCRRRGATGLRWAGASIGVVGLLFVANAARQPRLEPRTAMAVTRSAAPDSRTVPRALPSQSASGGGHHELTSRPANMVGRDGR